MFWRCLNPMPIGYFQTSTKTGFFRQFHQLNGFPCEYLEPASNYLTKRLIVMLFSTKRIEIFC